MYKRQVVDIALFGKHTVVVNGSVPPVFLIHEILFRFFGKFRFFQFINQITPVFFFIVDGRINPVAVKVLCKVDNVL